ncbi:unnamed protein product [Rotaria magnacalcarata]
MSTLFTLSIFYTTIVSTVYCVDLKGITVTKDEIIALTRDHFGRVDPDSLLNGFFPVWAVIQFCLAAKCKRLFSSILSINIQFFCICVDIPIHLRIFVLSSYLSSIESTFYFATSIFGHRLISVNLINISIAYHQ